MVSGQMFLEDILVVHDDEQENAQDEDHDDEVLPVDQRRWFMHHRLASNNGEGVKRFRYFSINAQACVEPVLADGRSCGYGELPDNGGARLHPNRFQFLSNDLPPRIEYSVVHSDIYSFP